MCEGDARMDADTVVESATRTQVGMGLLLKSFFVQHVWCLVVGAKGLQVSRNPGASE